MPVLELAEAQAVRDAREIFTGLVPAASMPMPEKVELVIQQQVNNYYRSQLFHGTLDVTSAAQDGSASFTAFKAENAVQLLAVNEQICANLQQQRATTDVKLSSLLLSEQRSMANVYRFAIEQQLAGVRTWANTKRVLTQSVHQQGQQEGRADAATEQSTGSAEDSQLEAQYTIENGAAAGAAALLLWHKTYSAHLDGFASQYQVHCEVIDYTSAVHIVLYHMFWSLSLSTHGCCSRLLSIRLEP